MIVVFVGPTLPQPRVEDLLRGLEVQVLPPAAQGDLYRAARRRPQAIGLIDGTFGDAPAVWHKEILWALKQGVPVLGASSMGALRAAELEHFGMQGVGAIFEAYRDGRLVDDDEVALCHAPAELGHVPLSEPLVNIRATLAAARDAGALNMGLHDVALTLARRLHYKDRSWDAVCAGLAAQGQPDGSLRAWLAEGGRVDQKALDAQALLANLARGVTPSMRVQGWHFEHTAMWDELVRVHGGSAPPIDPGHVDRRLRRLAEDPAAWQAAVQAALARLLACDVARREGKHVDDDELMAALQTLREAHRLHTPADVDAWLDSNDLDTNRLMELLANQVRLSWVTACLAQDIEPHLLDHLKVAGNYRE